MKRLWLVLALCLVAPFASGGETLTYLDLIKQVADLERLATLPLEGETCRQWSSYDRGSKYDAATDTYVGWDKNDDGRGIIRKEGDVSVFAEMEGPGCIWRIWSADAKAGHVKVYLDGAAQPTIDLAFDDYFNRKVKPFVYPSVVNTTASGRNNYMPIPYQKSCKVTADPGWGNYFHFGYRTYPKGTILPTFKMELAAEETAALEAADRILTQCGGDPAGKRTGEQTQTVKVDAAAGTACPVVSIDGPRAITNIKVNIDLPASPEDRKRLRELALRISWDGEAEPSVWTPLGDFFGTAPGVNKYKSLPLGMTDDGFYSRWYMPFGKSALVELVNDGETAATGMFTITHAPLTKPIDQLGYFHAKWHRDNFLEAKRKIDWTMLKTQGRGRFCGVMLHVWNPKGGWWGEGDEKFFVDGEKFPSTIGTGSEDYFGYAWGNPALFQNCYHNQTISMGNKGQVSVNRWHITDNVPFQKSFEAAIEKYFPNNRNTLYACSAYWYLAPGSSDIHKPAPFAERFGYWNEMPPHKIKGAIEGERMKILKKTGGNTAEQEMTGYEGEWSDDLHLWWTGAKPGDKLDLELPSEAGKFDLKIRLTKAVDYGIVQVWLDGKKLGQPIDLFNDGVIGTPEISMGVQELTQGPHTLTFEIVGANEKAVKSYMVGIDYVKLEAAK